MCEPTTIAILATAGATGIKAYGESQSAKYEEEQANANAKLAEMSAANAEVRGAAAAGKLRMEGSEMVAEQRAAVAGNWIDTASAAGLFASTRAGAELDALTAKHSAAMEAWGHRVEKEQYKAQAKMAKRKSVLAPLTSLVGGASSIAGTMG